MAYTQISAAQADSSLIFLDLEMNPIFSLKRGSL